jgi:hypothetical protein
MNLAKKKEKNWDVNEKVKRGRLVEIVKDLYGAEGHAPLKIEITDLHKVNPKFYEEPGEDYQIKYRW